MRRHVNFKNINQTDLCLNLTRFDLIIFKSHSQDHVIIDGITADDNSIVLARLLTQSYEQLPAYCFCANGTFGDKRDQNIKTKQNNI